MLPPANQAFRPFWIQARLWWWTPDFHASRRRKNGGFTLPRSKRNVLHGKAPIYLSLYTSGRGPTFLPSILSATYHHPDCCQTHMLLHLYRTIERGVRISNEPQRPIHNSPRQRLSPIHQATTRKGKIITWWIRPPTALQPPPPPLKLTDESSGAAIRF